MLKSILLKIKYIFVAISIYFIMAIAGTLIAFGKKNAEVPQQITIFVRSNGIHTEIALPLINKQINWLDKLSANIAKKYGKYKYLSFGWGDYDFYRESRTQPSSFTTIKSIFWPSKSLIHLKLIKHIPFKSEKCIPITVSEAQYQALIQYIRDWAITDQEEKLEILENGYGSDDYFIKSKGKYHLFFTCNNWTATGLKRMGVRIGIWTPFEQSVMYHLK